MYESFLSERLIANLAHASQEQVACYREAGIIYPQQQLDDGSYLYRPNAIAQVRFANEAHLYGLDSADVRHILNAVEVLGGGSEYIRLLIDEKIMDVRARYTSLLETERRLSRLEQMFAAGNGACEAMSSRPQSRGGNTLM